MGRIRTLPLALLIPLLVSPPAHADVESWNGMEIRVPLHHHHPLQPSQLRLSAGGRWGFRYPGLGQQYFRIGPFWDLAPHFSFSTHLVSYAEQSDPGVLTQEYRLELDPTLHWKFGDFKLSDRNRVEYRWSWGSDLWKYRNRLQLAYNPKGAQYHPFFWDEVHYGFTGAGIDQNRLALGVSKVFNESSRLDIAYVFRQRKGASNAWENDHILSLSYLVDLQWDEVFDAVGDGEP